MVASKRCEKSRGWGRARVWGTLEGTLGSLCSRPHAPHAPLREGSQGQPCGICTLDAGCGLNIGNVVRLGHGPHRAAREGRQQARELSARPGDREPLGEKEPRMNDVQRG